MDEIFTVIVPVYNNKEYLSFCLDSIIQQTYNNIELIIADDKSNSFNLDYYYRYVQEHNQGNIKKTLIYQNNENFGTVKNLNIAIQKSSGKYIKLLANDDMLYDNTVLENMAIYLENSPSEIVVCDVVFCDLNGKVFRKYDSFFLQELAKYSSIECFSKLCVRNHIKAAGVFFQRVFFEKYGLFDEDYKLLEDWPTWLSFFLNNGTMRYNPIIAVKYRTESGVVSNNNPQYLTDRRRVFTDIIKPNKHLLSKSKYYRSLISSYLFSNVTLRKIYSQLLRFTKK